MWGNLKNLGSKMEQIGSAIAPVLAADSGEYSDEDEYDEEDYYEDEEEYETEQPPNNSAPFGFVGMITKALDREQKDYSESHPDQEEEVIDLIPDDDDYYPQQNNSDTMQQQQSHPAVDHDWSDSYDTTPRVPASSLHVEEKFPISPSAKLRHASQLMVTTKQKDSEMTQPANNDETSIPYSHNKATIAPKDDETDSALHPNKPSMSPLSPFHPEQLPSHDPPLQAPTTTAKVRSSPSEISKRSPATSKVMMPTEEEVPRRPSLIREKGSVSPNTPKLTKPVARDPGQVTSEEVVVGINSPSNSNKAQRPSFLYAPPLASEASSDDDDVAAVDEQDDEEDEEEEEDHQKEDDDDEKDHHDTDMASTRLTKEAIEAQEPKVTSSSPPKSNSSATSHSASSTSPVQRQRHAFKLPPPRPVGSPGTPPDPLISSPSTSHESRPVPQVPIMKNTKEVQTIEDLRRTCQILESQLKQSQSQVQALRKQIADTPNANRDEALFIQFQEKEARLLEAAAEEHQQQLNILRGELEGKLGAIQRQLKHEQGERQQEKQKLDRQLEDARRRAEAVEREAKLMQARQEVELSNKARALEHSLRISEDKLARSMALMDEREEELAALKKNMKSLQSTVTEHREGAEEVEEEIDELHAENESLRQHVELVEAQCTQLKIKVEELQADSEKMTALKLELRMMREDRDRDLAKIQTVTETTSATSAQLEKERAALSAEVHDLKRQLTAAHADIDIARADTERVMTANANLQHALEAFQSERDAELALLEEQRRDMEDAIAAAHAAALEATHEANEAAIRRMKEEANEEVAKIRLEVKKLEEKNEHLKADNVQMRRSLDEAIQRLQSTQEDIIDRTIMKNILLDWLSKPAAKERRQVLEVMANLLHFTEEEKEKVHLVDEGAFGKIVHSVAQLPPPKADVDQLKGENVREKWVNFLLSEIED